MYNTITLVTNNLFGVNLIIYKALLSFCLCSLRYVIQTFTKNQKIDAKNNKKNIEN
jgi:hypothetical protein